MKLWNKFLIIGKSEAKISGRAIFAEPKFRERSECIDSEY